MRYCEERNIGYQTPWARVPIVPAAVIFDLNVGASSVRPTADSGYAAAVAAVVENIAEGRVGAGTGATVGKWGGLEWGMHGGLGIASQEKDGVICRARRLRGNTVGIS